MTGYASFQRVLLDIEYDGTDFCGWQRQRGERSVQGEIERALKAAVGKPASVYGASRTDAGVHALGQRAHFDSFCTIPPEKFPYVLNNLMPFDVRIQRAQPVHETFHARFSARGKIYTYRIHNHRHACAIRRNTTAHVPVSIDEGKMREAARLVLGTHDFAAFAAAGSAARTTVRSISSIDITREGDDITMILRGNAFLYNMVRIIAGTLISIGQSRMPETALTSALETGNRLLLGVTAPPEGLELTHIFYDDYD